MNEEVEGPGEHVWTNHEERRESERNLGTSVSRRSLVLEAPGGEDPGNRRLVVGRVGQALGVGLHDGTESDARRHSCRRRSTLGQGTTATGGGKDEVEPWVCVTCLAVLLPWKDVVDAVVGR